MILENMLLPTAGATVSIKSDSGASTVPMTVDASEERTKPEGINQGRTMLAGQTVSAAGSNMFVVKLEPSPGAAKTPKKTNLLRLFSENGGGVKALGIGRIVINRTLLRNAKPKPSTTPSTVIRLDTAGLPKPPISLHGLGEKNFKNDKKDDEISGNLANFMNFKLGDLVPTAVKTELTSKSIFHVNLKSPEIRLPQVRKNSEQSTVVNSLPSSKPAVASRAESPEPSDDDLTSLSWLTGSNKNLLKTIQSCNPDDFGISLSGDESEEEDEFNVAANRGSAVFTAKSRVESSSQGGFATRQYGQGYSPNGKPPYSFSCLIFMAVEDSLEKMLPVKEIYAWVCKHFPYFQTAPSGWKNSIRHNLSLNKCFKKAEHGKHTHDPGKGSLWCIDPAYRPNLIQALKRTPFYPYLHPSGISQPLSLSNLVSLLPGIEKHRIPFWSPSFSQRANHSYDPDVASAALNLIGLKGNDGIDQYNVRSTVKELAAEIFSQNEETPATIPLVISDPADDHTYSAVSVPKPPDGRCLSPESDKSAPDAAYEFETCGTDCESDVEGRRASNGDSESECDLADSGFAGLIRARKPATCKRKKNAAYPGAVAGKKGRARSSARSSSKSTQTPPKRRLKVRFQSRKRPDASPKPKVSAKSRKRKLTPPELADGLSDVDSGKDSPKVVARARRRAPPRRVVPSPPQKKKKQKKALSSPATPRYGTRSTTQTRHSKRIGAIEGNVLQRASARRRKQDSITFESDDEEVKLAAGYLLHLAGFRSPA